MALGTKRSIGIDFLRFICAFFIICIHTTFTGKAIILPLTRTAVPVFFMITGYFYTEVEITNRKNIQIKKILRLTFVSAIMYITWDIISAFFISNLPFEPALFVQFAAVRLDYLFFKSPEAWFNYLLFNEPPFSTHLWYLSAMLYVLLIIAAFSRFIGRRYLYFLIPLLLSVSFLLDTYSEIILNKTFPIMIHRNFVFRGLPFFLLGDLIQKKENRKKISTQKLYLLFICSITLIYLEHYYIVKKGGSQNSEIYLGIILLSVVLLLLAERNLPIFSRKPVKILAEWGNKYSSGIYITHMFLIGAIKIFANKLTPLNSNNYLCEILTTPIFVLIFNLLMLSVWNRIKSGIKRK